MDISNLEKTTESLQETCNLFGERKDDISRDACIYNFKNTYEISLKMIERYLKMYHCNSAEIEKFTFFQIIKMAKGYSLLRSDLETWKAFRECRIKYNESYEEEISKKILAVIPNFLEEIQHLIIQLKENNHERI